MTDNQMSFLEKNAAILKVFTIGVLALLLMLPVGMVTNLVTERQTRQEEATTEIAFKWGEAQQITGPVLSIPYDTYELNKEGERINLSRNYTHYLPETLDIRGVLVPEIRYRGIFEVPVYTSRIRLEGFFEAPELNISEPHAEIHWDEAFLTVGISDLKGISQAIDFMWNGQPRMCEPGTRISGMIPTGVTIADPLVGAPPANPYPFVIELSLNGSKNLSFIPLGRETTAEIQSSWTDPGFDGAFLPAQREISGEGFKAGWRVLELNRNYPQAWTNRDINFGASAFGVNLVTPLETYQVTERSTKYAILFIGLTFVVFFFIEILRKLRVHPIQYILVGFGLSLFYLLLLSLSEHLGFGMAYFAASLGIIVMIAGYARSIFKDTRLALVMAAFLAVLYGFLYILIQMEDFALLFGAIGLFVILSMVMYLSRKVDWYVIGASQKEAE
ncbi:MAG: cell envelope integrity protein CreD [Bacteroidales bacterium]|nr:cell envelope integrity protein CreD [Bacteroidales bacterium]